MSELALSAEPVLSRHTVARDEIMRTDEVAQRRGWADSLVLLLDERLRTPLVADPDPRVRLYRGAEIADAPPEDAVLLGTAPDGVVHWTVPAGNTERDEDWQDLRSCGSLLDDTGAGLLTTAVAVQGWHAKARFCGICGSATRRHAAGWARICTACGHEEYPRTDPAVICLVHDVEDTHVLLARQPRWPPGRFSVLAGFVEAGESLEASVIREVGEEVGVVVRDVHYLGSQPWPFPRSLMIGFSAVAERGEVTPAEGEIEQARWVSREQLVAALAAGAWTGREGEGTSADDPGPDGLILPGDVSIARRMLEGWARVAPSDTS